MKHLLSCEFNFDTVCVELKFSDGSMIAIDPGYHRDYRYQAAGKTECLNEKPESKWIRDFLVFD